MKQFDELRFRELVGEYLDHAEADMATEVAEQYFDELEKENRKMAEEQMERMGFALGDEILGHD